MRFPEAFRRGRLCIMNSKEQLPSHTDNGTERFCVSEPEELPDLLKQALLDAYPDPGGRIASKVMDQIRAEREDADRRRRADKAELRRHRHGLIMKYGGLAACMVILSGALVIASPLMGRTADTAAMEADTAAAYCTADETVPETAVYTEGTAACSADLYADEYADADLYTEEAEAEENTLLTAAAPAEKSAEMEEGANGMVKMRSARPANGFDTILSDAAHADDGHADNGHAENGIAEREDHHAFVWYLIENGYLTEEEYRLWNTARADADPWTPEELCDAFLLDPALYDTWVEK